VDENRIFIGGISKGGWTTTLLGEYELPRLAGLIVLLAGRVRSTALPRELAALKNKPVYIGSGETDPNLIPALQAAECYRRYGAVVTTDLYKGIGHAVPLNPPLLKEWLETQGRYRQAAISETTREALEGQFRNELHAIIAQEDVLARYNSLLKLANDPRLSLCATGLVAEVQDQIVALRKQPPAKENWIAERTFNDLLWLDSNLRTLEDMKTVRDGLKRLSETYAQTWHGTLAAGYYSAVAAAYEKSLEATRKANEGARNMAASNRPVGAVKFPTFDDSLPRKPVIRTRP
jgi:hypothetical protein